MYNVNGKSTQQTQDDDEEEDYQDTANADQDENSMSNLAKKIMKKILNCIIY